MLRGHRPRLQLNQEHVEELKERELPAGQHRNEFLLRRKIFIEDRKISLVTPMTIGDIIPVKNIAYVFIPAKHDLFRNSGIDSEFPAI